MNIDEDFDVEECLKCDYIELTSTEANCYHPDGDKWGVDEELKICPIIASLRGLLYDEDALLNYVLKEQDGGD